MSVNEVRAALENVADFLENYSVLANCHMVHYFSHEYHKTVLTDEMKLSLDCIHKPGDIPLFLMKQASFKSDFQFSNVKTLTKNYLENFLSGIRNNSFLSLSKIFQVESLERAFEFNPVGDKKSYEIQHVCNILLSKWKREDLDSVLDIGSGKGLLGQTLSAISGWRVVGLDVMNLNETENTTREKYVKVS